VYVCDTVCVCAFVRVCVHVSRCSSPSRVSSGPETSVMDVLQRTRIQASMFVCLFGNVNHRNSRNLGIGLLFVKMYPSRYTACPPKKLRKPMSNKPNKLLHTKALYDVRLFVCSLTINTTTQRAFSILKVSMNGARCGRLARALVPLKVLVCLFAATPLTLPVLVLVGLVTTPITEFRNT